MADKRFLNPDLGRLILRFVVGGLMLFHGIHKLTHGMAFHQKLLVDHGLPSFLVYGIPLGEVIAPILILAGLFARPAALVEGFTMIMAIYLAFGEEAFSLNKGGGIAVELNLLYLLGCVALFFLGSGKYSVRGGTGKWD